MLLVRQTRGPSARGSIRPVHADFGFVGADAGAAAGVDGSYIKIGGGEFVFEELAIIII